MTALDWKEYRHSHTASETVTHSSRLCVFALHVRDDSNGAVRWNVNIEELFAADGPAASVDEGKRAAEAWVRGYLHDLLRQLRDPAVS